MNLQDRKKLQALIHLIEQSGNPALKKAWDGAKSAAEAFAAQNFPDGNAATTPAHQACLNFMGEFQTTLKEHMGRAGNEKAAEFRRALLPQIGMLASRSSVGRPQWTAAQALRDALRMLSASAPVPSQPASGVVPVVAPASAGSIG